MSSQTIIAQPYTLKNGTVIKNRLLKSAMSEALVKPMVRLRLHFSNTLRRLGNSGIGICITGNVMIDHRALGEPAM